LGNDAYYFKNTEEVAGLIALADDGKCDLGLAEKNYKKLEENYNWEKVTEQYYELFLKFVKTKNDVSAKIQ
jgi:glycosyltransferase involved in cell wall biosynthesis